MEEREEQEALDEASASTLAEPRPVVEPVASTRRLTIRPLTLDDAPFIWELVTDADWLRFIGDRGVHTVDDAERYLTDGPLASYAAHGHGLWCVELRATQTPIGICGLLRRDWLDDADLGFALLPAFRGSGYALEAAQAVVGYGFDALAMSRILAIVTPANAKSVALLRRLGMHLTGEATPPGATTAVAVYGVGVGLG